MSTISVNELMAVNANLRNKLAEWNRAAADVGYAGSEYIDDPKRVFARVRETQQAQMQVIRDEKARLAEVTRNWEFWKRDAIGLVTLLRAHLGDHAWRAVQQSDPGKEYDALKAREARLREVAKKAPCTCSIVYKSACPDCGDHLWPVTNDSRYLNDDQFAAVCAGDFYCKTCKSDQAKSGYKYFWKGDVFVEKKTCDRCATLSPTGEPQAQPSEMEPSRDELIDLIDSLRDPDPCYLDHHGYCQAHSYLYDDPPCPHGRAAKIPEIIQREKEQPK